MKYSGSSRIIQLFNEKYRPSSLLLINLQKVCSRIDWVYGGKTVLVWVTYFLL